MIAALVAALPYSAARADVVHLRNGTTLKAQNCREDGAQILCHRAGGIFGFSRDEVIKIDREPAGPPPAPLSQIPRARASKADQEAPPPAIQPPGFAAVFGGPRDWRARIAEIDYELGRPGVDAPPLRKESAILFTLLGNEAYKSGDLDGAEAAYMRATDMNPSLTAPVLNLARLRLTQGRDDEAESLVEEVLVVQPDDPATLALMGIVDYRKDRLDEAVEVWEKSLALRPDDGLARRLAKAKRELDVEQNFYRSDAPHFTLKYDGDKASEQLSNEILDYLETAYGDLTSRFDEYPASVILVTLYSRRDFHDVTESPSWVGGLFDGQIRIPIGGLTHLNNASRSVLTHELTHCIVYAKTHGAAPRWLQEGIAQLMEGKSAAKLEASLAEKYASYTPARLADEFSYPLSLSLVEHFIKTWSFSHLLDLLSALGHGSDMDAAFMTVTGDGVEAFLSGWLRDHGRTEAS